MTFRFSSRTALAVLIGTLLVGSVSLTSPAAAADRSGDNDIRVTSTVSSFSSSRRVGSDLLALLGASDDLTDRHVLAKGSTVPVVAVPLDGDSEMVTVQPLDGRGRGLEHSQLAVRSHDGARWSGWELLHFDGEEGPDAVPGGRGMALLLGPGTVRSGPSGSARAPPRSRLRSSTATPNPW